MAQWCRLPPMCPRFDSRTRRHILVLSLLPGFFSGFSCFPPSTKTNSSKFQFDLEIVDEEPPRGNATANSHYHSSYYYSPRYRCCLNRIEVNTSLVLKRTVRVEQKATYVYLVPKRVAHTKRKEIFVYLVLKRVVRVGKKATYYLHCSTCIPSGTEGNVHFACSKIALPKWSGKQYTLMCTYLVRKRVAFVGCTLTSFESVLQVWNGLRYIIYLPLFEACFSSGTERNITFPSFGNTFLLVVKGVYRVDQKAMYQCERSKSRNLSPTESNIDSFRCFSVLPKQDSSSRKRLPRSETPTND